MRSFIPEIVTSYIMNEINMSYSELPNDKKDILISVCTQLVNQLISFEAGHAYLLGIGLDPSLLRKLNAIMNVEDQPLHYPTEFPVKTKACNSRKKSAPWSDIEDVRLTAAIFRHGPKDWKQIAEFVGNGRNASQCNQRWCRALDPTISRTPWTSEEDSLLIKTVTLVGDKNWCQVARLIPQRTDLQCRYRYTQLSRMNRDIFIEKQKPVSSADRPPHIDLNTISKARRPSITIAPFIIPEIGPTIKKDTHIIPYYLDHTLEPRNGKPESMLHRVPPLLISRQCA